MSYSTSPTDILTAVAGTMVAQQKYATVEDALKELALSAVRSKTTAYRRRIRRLERKYSTDFDTFSAHLVGKATPAVKRRPAVYQGCSAKVYQIGGTTPDTTNGLTGLRGQTSPVCRWTRPCQEVRAERSWHVSERRRDGRAVEGGGEGNGRSGDQDEGILDGDDGEHFVG